MEILLKLNGNIKRVKTNVKPTLSTNDETNLIKRIRDPINPKDMSWTKMGIYFLKTWRQQKISKC